jgi:hypothetical protein
MNGKNFYGGDSVGHQVSSHYLLIFLPQSLPSSYPPLTHFFTHYFLPSSYPPLGHQDLSFFGFLAGFLYANCGISENMISQAGLGDWVARMKVLVPFEVLFAKK